MNTSLRFALKKSFMALLGLLLCGVATRTIAQRTPAAPPDACTYNSRLSAAPLLFTENKGQVTGKNGDARPNVLFTAHSTGAKIFITATGIHYQFDRMVYPEGYDPNERKVKDPEKQQALHSSIKTETARFTLSLKGANANPVIRKEEQNSYTENFYLANCAISRVATYQRLVYENVYPGIDWVIYAKGQHLEYDFIVHPGSDPGLLKLKITDAKKVSIAADGILVMATTLGEVKEAAPVSFNGSKKIATAFKQAADGSIGFSVGRYNPAKDLRIDPSVTWATYYGGTGLDYAYTCATDGSGNVYLGGQTNTQSGFASGGFQNTYGGNSFDAFLVKFSSSGSRLWATYYGGTGNDYGQSCTVDGDGNVFLAGYTNSTTGIASGGFQNTIGGVASDAYLVKFNSSGSRLWATYYGGSAGDVGNSCAVDADGNVFLAGNTTSTTDIASGGFQNTYGGSRDAFLVKFNSSGSRLWATYYGGTSSEDFGYCAADGIGNVYLAGRTASTSGIASGGFQDTYGGGSLDAFLVKFSSSGSRLWATYYGGYGSSDAGLSCAVDGNGNVYMAGITDSDDGIASGGFQNTYDGRLEAFLVKFSSSGSRLWGTYYGGVAGASGRFCAVDGSGNVHLAGYTTSPNNIASGGFQNTYKADFDVFLVKFSSSGSRLWGTYYGDYGDDESFCCAVDGSGNVYLAGATTSTAGIASNGYQNTYGGNSNYDAFLAKINGSTILPISLYSFEVEKTAVTALLHWHTARETSANIVYELQRSADGRGFATIGRVPSLGSTTSSHSYTFTDAAPLQGTNYYRLRIIEKDGAVTYSPIRLLNFGSQVSIAVFPNPTKDKATVTGLGAGMQLQLLNAAGQLVSTRQATANTVTLLLSNLATGVYQLQVKTADGRLLTAARLVKE